MLTTITCAGFMLLGILVALIAVAGKNLLIRRERNSR